MLEISGNLSSSSTMEKDIVYTETKRYSVYGTNIVVSWREFLPDVNTNEPLDPYQAVVFLTGWGYTEQAKSTVALSQALANYSHMRVYAVDTYTEQDYSHSLLIEATAVKQFIDEKGLREKIIVGQSQGGSASIYIAAISEGIEGLVLIDSMGLYKQHLGNFIINYARENINSMLMPQYPPHSDIDALNAINAASSKDGLAEIQRQMRLARGFHHYLKRVLNEIQQMLIVNPYSYIVKTPIIIVHGANDKISQPERIIPYQGKFDKAPYIQDMCEREQFLQEHLFPNSPYVRMIVAEKMGYHGLPAFRPKEVASSSLYLLDRWHRTKQ